MGARWQYVFSSRAHRKRMAGKNILPPRRVHYMKVSNGPKSIFTFSSLSFSKSPS